MVDERLYKQTEVGKIPLEWRVAKIKEIGDVKMCRRIFNHQTKIIGDIPFYKIGTFGKEPDAFISKELYHDYRLKFSFPRKGDILISAAGTIGRTIVYNGDDSYFQDSNIVWVDNKKQIVSNEYLYYVYQIIKYNTEGGTIQRLYNSILLNAAFPLPPKLEQAAIATALSDMDELIAQTEMLIEKMKAIKKGFMLELLRPK
jgi:type I restriction enzyme S subunit